MENLYSVRIIRRENQVVSGVYIKEFWMFCGVYVNEFIMKSPRPCGAQLLWTWYPNRSIAPEIPYPKGVTDVCKVLTDVPLSSFERRGQMSPRWLYE